MPKVADGGKETLVSRVPKAPLGILATLEVPRGTAISRKVARVLPTLGRGVGVPTQTPGHLVRGRRLHTREASAPREGSGQTADILPLELNQGRESGNR